MSLWFSLAFIDFTFSQSKIGTSSHYKKLDQILQNAIVNAPNDDLRLGILTGYWYYAGHLRQPIKIFLPA
jgi:hypothetical protein